MLFDEPELGRRRGADSPLSLDDDSDDRFNAFVDLA